MIKNLTLKSDVVKALYKATRKRGNTNSKVIREALDFFKMFGEFELSSKNKKSINYIATEQVKNLTIPDEVMYFCDRYSLSISKFVDYILRYFLMSDVNLSSRKIYSHAY